MKPKIDILIITYNHQDYISRTIESVLVQKHDFTYRINIADDFSTDKTREILLDYKEKYPEVINLIFSDKNYGGKRNFINGLKYLTWDYISCLDGDDYWCNDYKLQKQIAFLEENKDFVACAHNTLVSFSNGLQKIKFEPRSDTTYSIRDLLDGSISFNSSSLVFRNVFCGKIPVLQENEKAEDLFFLILHAQFGKIRYLNEVMSVYNIHGCGEWSSMDEEVQINKTIEILTYANEVLEQEDDKKYAKYGIKKIQKNLYKKIIRNKERGALHRLHDYLFFRYNCYLIKIYEFRKSRGWS